MNLLAILLLSFCPLPVHQVGEELSKVKLNIGTGYYGARYTDQILPELRANGCLHDFSSHLGLMTGWPLEIGKLILFPRFSVNLKLLGVVSPGYSDWKVGLGDMSTGLETRFLKRFSLHFDVVTPTGSYYDRLGEGLWAATVGTGYKIEEKGFLQGDLLWYGENPDGINLGDGAVIQIGYKLPNQWFLSSSFGAFLPDRGEAFNLHDRFTLDWTTRIEKKYKIGSNWTLNICLEQTLWGLDTQVWTLLEVNLQRQAITKT